MTVDLAPSRSGALPVSQQRIMSLAEKIEYAEQLAGAGLLPEQFRRQPANVLWAMEYGEALNLPTIVAITSVHVIEGKPAPSAGMMSALVRSKGHRLRVGWSPPTGDARWGTGWAEIVRRDDPEFTFRAEWTVERAAQAEICKIADGKIEQRTKTGKTGNWQKFPIQMMKARALGEVCRDGAQECLLGMSYLAEELDVDLDENGQVVAPRWDTPPTRDFPGPVRTSDVADSSPQARPLVEHYTPVDNAEDVGIIDPDELADDAKQPVQRRTLNAIMALFTKAGIDTRADRARRLRVCEILTGRTFTSSNDLTEDDGLVVEAALRARGDQVTEYVRGLLAEDDAERAIDAARGE